jgi:RES domain
LPQDGGGGGGFLRRRFAPAGGVAADAGDVGAGGGHGREPVGFAPGAPSADGRPVGLAGILCLGQALNYGVLYAAVARDGAFAETIGRKPRTFWSNDELAALAMTTLGLTRELRLVDLHGGEAVGAIGATGVVGVGPQSLVRRSSKALHAHPDLPDGIEYRCRHNSDEIAIALFDRIGGASLTSIGVTSLVLDLAWLNAMRGRHQILEPLS